MAAPPDSYQAFPGSAAFSDFRLNRLAAAIGAKKLQAIWVHYVASKQDLSSEQIKVLEQLLEYGAYPDASDELYSTCVKAIKNGSGSDDANTLLLYVVPRAGTISPWSSKATSIATVCGLGDNVQRVERGLLFAISFDGFAPSEVSNPDSLHDRMTETMSTSPPDLKTMFAQLPRRLWRGLSCCRAIRLTLEPRSRRRTRPLVWRSTRTKSII